MRLRRYTLKLFKRDGLSQVHGAKTRRGPLDLMMQLLLAKFSPETQVRVLGGGRYIIGNHEAELAVEK